MARAAVRAAMAISGASYVAEKYNDVGVLEVSI